MKKNVAGVFQPFSLLSEFCVSIYKYSVFEGHFISRIIIIIYLFLKAHYFFRVAVDKNILADHG
jgi:hypothetical protein